MYSYIGESPIPSQAPLMKKKIIDWVRRYLADLMERTDCVQWHLLHTEALPGSAQNKPAVQSAGMSSQRCLKKSEIQQTHTAFRLIKKWPFLAKSQASKGKKDCQLKVMCLSRRISVGTFLWIRTMGRRRFVSVYTTSTRSFLISDTKMVLWLTWDLHWITLLPNQDSWLCTLSTRAISLTGGINSLKPFMTNDNISTNILTSCHREKRTQSCYGLGVTYTLNKII